MLLSTHDQCSIFNNFALTIGFYWRYTHTIFHTNVWTHEINSQLYSLQQFAHCKNTWVTSTKFLGGIGCISASHVTSSLSKNAKYAVLSIPWTSCVTHTKGMQLRSTHGNLFSVWFNFFFTTFNSHVVPVVNSKARSHETSCLHYIPFTYHLQYWQV